MPRMRTVLVTLVLAMLPSSLLAQGPRFTIGAFGGAFVSAADLFDEQDITGVLRFGHKTSFSVGGRAAIWITPRLAVEAEGAYNPSDVNVKGTIIGSSVADTTFSASVITGSLNLVYAVIKPPLEPLSIYISGGVGIIARSGDFYDFFEAVVAEPEKTTVGGVVGIGLSYGIARTLNIRFDVRDYISSYSVISGANSELQNDIILTAGLELALGG